MEVVDQATQDKIMDIQNLEATIMDIEIMGTTVAMETMETMETMADSTAITTTIATTTTTTTTTTTITDNLGMPGKDNPRND